MNPAPKVKASCVSLEAFRFTLWKTVMIQQTRECARLGRPWINVGFISCSVPLVSIRDASWPVPEAFLTKPPDLCTPCHPQPSVQFSRTACSAPGPRDAERLAPWHHAAYALGLGAGGTLRHNFFAGSFLISRGEVIGVALDSPPSRTGLGGLPLPLLSAPEPCLALSFAVPWEGRRHLSAPSVAPFPLPPSLQLLCPPLPSTRQLAAAQIPSSPLAPPFASP